MCKGSGNITMKEFAIIECFENTKECFIGIQEFGKIKCTSCSGSGRSPIDLSHVIIL